MKQVKARAKAVHKNRFAGMGLKSTSAHPGYAQGGSAHSDAAEDRAMIKDMVKPEALNRARGGRASKKGSRTHINIVVGQPGGGQAAGPMPGPMVPPGAMPRPPMPMPPGAPGMAPGMAPGAPGAGIGALGGTAGIPRKTGGKVHMTAGAGSGKGRKEKQAWYGDK